jgi:hypothetical protein
MNEVFDEAHEFYEETRLDLNPTLKVLEYLIQFMIDEGVSTRIMSLALDQLLELIFF